MSDNQLGVFLRARREAVTPAEVGLPNGRRRRTPGLRRSELAMLAGISVEYLTRLEQGRDRHPSAQVIGALAEALRLSNGERRHLALLAKSSDGRAVLCPASDPPATTVRPTVRALLDGLEPAPALVLNRLGDVLAHTAGLARLAGPLGLLDAEPPNLLRYVFTDPRARSAYPDWDRIADEHVASLRHHCGAQDPHAEDLVADLTIIAGAAFADRFAARGIPRRTGVERLNHPDAGMLRLAYESLDLPDAGDQRLLVYLPADDATSAALAELTGRRPGALRVVSG